MSEKEEGGVISKTISSKEQECIEKMKKDGWKLESIEKHLKNIEEQTPEFCLEVVKQNGRALQCIKEQTPEICWEAVKQFGWALQFVENQTPEICLEALKRNTYALRYVAPKFYLELIKRRPDLVTKIKDRDDEIFLTAIYSQPSLFKSIQKNLSPDIFKEAKVIYSSRVETNSIKSYRQIRSQLANREIVLEDSPYHVLETMCKY